MSQRTAHMPPARRRAIPGLGSVPSAPPPPNPPVDTSQPDTKTTPASTDPIATPGLATSSAGAAAGAAQQPGRVRRRPAADYATTRLVNFRIPVDLHDHYRQLVRDAEQQYPRLRHPSLTELLIALLEEGPQTPTEVAQLIRRKRAAEHAEEASA